jgi:hypothetical protein
MLKRSSSYVLASLKASAYPGQTPVPTGGGWAGETVRCLGTPLAAALPDLLLNIL